MRRIKQAFDCEIFYTFFVLLTKQVMVCTACIWLFIAKRTRPQGRRKIDNWGGGIFIYSCSHTVKTIDFKIYITISKEINCDEHEYMNIAPPPIIDLPAPLVGLGIHDKLWL